MRHEESDIESLMQFVVEAESEVEQSWVGDGRLDDDVGRRVKLEITNFPEFQILAGWC